MHRHISKGSWTFSDQDQGWQVSDCTAEGLKVLNYNVFERSTYSQNIEKSLVVDLINLYRQCCLLLSMMPPETVGRKMEPEQINEAVNVILSFQVGMNCYISHFHQPIYSSFHFMETIARKL